MRRVLFFCVCVIAGLAAGGWLVSSPERLSLARWLTPASPTASLPASLTASTETSAEPTLPQTSLSASALGSSVLHGPISYHDGIVKVAPSVVSLYAMSSDESAPSDSASQGSGVIVDANGIVLTNLHLIDGLDVIEVVLSDGRTFDAKLIGSDQETDLAVVRIEASNLPFLRLDEAQPLRVGDVVLAIGNPFGVGQTVTQGIVSATRRRVSGGSVWQNFIQIDAAINPGNSGGALINPYGQLVGVNTAVFRGVSGAVGIGYSIPADLLAQVVPQIIDNGYVARGWLGISVDDLNMFSSLQDSDIDGAIITGVLDDSPANSGGLKPLDIVYQLGEKPIRSATQLLLEVSALPPGATVKLSVYRSMTPNLLTRAAQQVQFESVDLKMTLGTRPNFSNSRNNSR